MREKRIRSKITSKSQTMIPRTIRQKLGIVPGDMLDYIETEQGIIIEKARVMEEAPFATFGEWSSEADEKAYADL